MDISIIKNDVVVELRSTRYYNEIEVSRLVGNQEISHRDKVLHIAALARENANINEALQLIEAYFPAQQPAAKLEPTE